MNVKITYKLTTAGQKASILAGGNGAAEQETQVGADDPLYRVAVEQADISADGAAKIDRVTYVWASWDHIPTVAELLAMPAAREAAQVAARAERAALDLAKARRILEEREESAGYTITDGQTWSQKSIYRSDFVRQQLGDLPELQAWQAKIDADNSVALSAAKTAASEQAAANAAKTAAAAAAKAALRAELGLTADEKIFRVEDGCLATVPVWESDERGKNWLAVISLSPGSPGGLDRQFAGKCRGSLYYQIDALSPGDAVEFGADAVSRRGAKTTNRWYGYVTRTVMYRPGTDDQREYLCMVECGDGKSAIKAAAKFSAAAAKAATA